MNPIESEADRQVFLEVFGEDVIVSGATIKGIVDYPYTETLDIAGRDPMVMCSTADLPDGLTYGDPVEIDALSFSGTVRIIQPDGVGMTTLMLRNA